ncbi:hypothetical protein ACN47E_007344 [Coniothyrium glycines]
MLNKMKPLLPNQYIAAFGHNGEYFYATPNGYFAPFLPPVVAEDIATGCVERVIWASFGSEPDSWFFSYETTGDSVPTHRIGTGIPSSLQSHIARNNWTTEASLRIQFGASGSYIVWSGTEWASHQIPHRLCERLVQGCNSMVHSTSDIRFGTLHHGTIDNIQWHHDGSWYIKSCGRHMGDFQAMVMQQAWLTFWTLKTTNDLVPTIHDELAYVAINPHQVDGGAFVFLKKQRQGEVQYLFRLDDGILYSSEKPDVSLAKLNPAKSNGTASQSLLIPPSASGKLPEYRWATSRKTGRPHRSDTWEIYVRKGQRIKVLRDMGNNWFLVEVNEENTFRKGYLHASWIDFGDSKACVNAAQAYSRFESDMQTLQNSGQICEFPRMATYISKCNEAECQITKQSPGSLDICIHDLTTLLEGSGQYTAAWLKEKRNMWHPDRFTRYCHSEHADRLKGLSAQIFALYSILMDRS